MSLSVSIINIYRTDRKYPIDSIKYSTWEYSCEIMFLILKYSNRIFYEYIYNVIDKIRIFVIEKNVLKVFVRFLLRMCIVLM